MKREKSLQPLSWQHHDTLMACLMIEKGISKQTDLAILQDFTRQFWNNDLESHFQLEERYLIPYLRKKNFPELYLRSLLNDHGLLRNFAARLMNGGASYELYQSFANLLKQHIHFEERLIFEKAQELIPENELQQLTKHFPDKEAASCKQYPVKFWE